MNSLDVQDWELLPNDGFLDDGGSKNQFITIPNPNTTASLMNYFFSPPKQVDTSVDPKMPNQLALEPTSPKLQEQREAARSPTQSEDEEDFVPQVFFKKTKDGRAEFHFEKGNSKADLEESRDRFNIWKLSLFGVAAAGVYIIISWGNSNKQHQQNQKHHRRN